jgi:hypothetical protein
VVIVGGGVAGLSAAWHLQEKGFENFVLLELERAPGGTARSGSNPSAVVPYPWGAHYVPAPLKENETLISLLSDMGVIEGADANGNPIIAEQFLCRDPEERIFFKGRWYEGCTCMQAPTNRISRNWINSIPKSAIGSNGETAKDSEHLRYRFRIAATMRRLQH